MAVTVDGVFRITDRASGTMRKMREEALRTDAAIAKLGYTTDKVGSRKQVSQMQGTERELKRLGRTTDETTKSVSGLSRESDNLSKKMRSAERDTGKVERAFRKLVTVTEGLGKIFTLIKFPALGAGIGVIVQAVGALSGGVISLVPKLTDLSGVLGALPATFLGVGGAVGVVKLAFSDLSKAMMGNKAALARLTPEAKSFLTVLKSYHPLMQEFRTSAQRGLFGGLTDAFKQLRVAAPVINQLIGMMSTRLGNLARMAAQRFTQRGFLADFTSIGNQGGRIVSRIGQGLLNMIDALRNVAVAAAPFTEWLTKTLLHFTAFMAQWTRAARESGRLAAFFDRTKDALRRFASIAEHVFYVLRDIGRAARPLGEDLYRSADRATKRWERLGSTLNQIQLTKTFLSMRDALHQMVGLVGDLGGAIFKMGGDNQLADMIAGLRTLVPMLQTILTNLARSLGPGLVTTLQQIGQLVVSLSTPDGPLAIMLNTISGVLRVVNTLIRDIPGLGKVLSIALATAGIYKAYLMVLKLAKSWLFVGSAAQQAASEQAGALAVAEGGGVAATAVEGRGAMPLIFGGSRSSMTGALGRGVTSGAAGGATEGETIAAAAAASRFGRFGRLGGLLGKVPRFGNLLFKGGVAARSGSLLGLGSEIGLGAGAARFGGLAARGVLGIASKVALPIAIATALYGGLTAKRDPNASLPFQAAQTGAGALSTLDFGLTGPLLSSGQVGANRAENVLQRKISTGDVHHILSGHATTIPGLRIEINELRTQRKLVQDLGILGATSAGKTVQALNQEITARKNVVAQMVKQRSENRHLYAVNVGGKISGQLAGAFGVVQKSQGTAAAIDYFRTHLLGRLGEAKRTGVRDTVAQQALDFIAEQKKQNPKMAATWDELTGQISKKLNSMGQNVHIVNNNILTGSKSQWKDIRTALENETELAKEHVSKNFTVMQQEAIGALQSMGYTKAAAQNFISGLEAGGSGSPLASKGVSGYGKKSRSTTLHAHGGRIGGTGSQDTVPVAPGNMAAPGELIVNRHTEARANQLLGQHGTSLASLVGGETRPHSIKVPQTSLTGAPGAAVMGLGRGEARGLNKRVAQAFQAVLGLTGGGGMIPGLGGFHGGGNAASNMALGRRMMLAAGFGADQWPALQALWTRESGWSQYAYNASSGATGIPQSLPGNKMASAGADWRTNPATQIAWGLSYIKGRYGSPQNAWAHEGAFNWYQYGGRVGASAPRGATSSTRQVAGGQVALGVHIGTIVIQNHREGDVQRIVVTEVQAALSEVARKLAMSGVVPEQDLLT